MPAENKLQNAFAALVHWVYVTAAKEVLQEMQNKMQNTNCKYILFLPRALIVAFLPCREPMEAEDLRKVHVHQISLGVCHSLAISDAAELWGMTQTCTLISNP